MNKIERVSAVLEGRQPDRLPISLLVPLWPGRTFRAKGRGGPRASRRDLRSRFSQGHVRRPVSVPHCADGIIDDVSDLDRLVAMRGDEDIFGRHLEVLHALSRRFAGELRMTTTLFNSWSTLRRLTARTATSTARRAEEESPTGATPRCREFLAEAPEFATALMPSPRRWPFRPQLPGGRGRRNLSCRP